jgi:hypothetical protein
MPKPRFSGFVPPVPPTIDGSHGIGKSLLAISTCMQLLHSPTPICRYAMANGFYLRLEVKSLATPPRSNGLRDFAILLQKFQVVDSLPLEESFAPQAFPAQLLLGFFPQQITKGLSLLSFPNSDSFRDFCVSSLCSTFNHSQSVEVFQTPVHSCNRNLSSFSQTRSETSNRPALHLHGSNNPTQLWADENESLTVEPPQRTLCGGIRLHSMQESPGSNRETIETHSRPLSQISNLP